MFVKDCMTPKPFGIKPDATVLEAQQFMTERKIRHLLVVDDAGKLVGLITVNHLRSMPWADQSLSGYETRHILTRLKARDVMIENPATVTQDVPIEEAARIMIDHRIRSLPVVEGDVPVGIVTDTDLLSTTMELLGARQAGIRATAVIPDQVGALAQLTSAMADAGGNLKAIGGWPVGNRWSMIMKVQGLPKEQVTSVLQELEGVEIVDVREL